MNLKEYIRICEDSAESGSLPLDWPEGWSELQKSLAFDRSGDWDRAHSIAQEIPDSQGSAVHAYLHRKEGVQWNAEYWYRRAGRKPFSGTLEDEWISLAEELLE